MGLLFFFAKSIMETEDEAQKEHAEAREVAKKKEAEVKAAQSGRQSLNKVCCRPCCNGCRLKKCRLYHRDAEHSRIPSNAALLLAITCK